MAPVIAQDKRNQEVKELIKREQARRIRVEQELATLVDDFNALMKQRRYPEAEILAKQAADLDPQNPVVVTMTWKARIARRDSMNQDLIQRKEIANWEALDEVERSAIPFYGNPMQFPDNWDDITNMRRQRDWVTNRQHSEDEIRIRESLDKRISLKFEDAPLTEVIEYIRDFADVNIVVDMIGLEEVGLTSNTPVSINLHAISLKHVLDLMLEPMESKPTR